MIETLSAVTDVLLTMNGIKITNTHGDIYCMRSSNTEAASHTKCGYNSCNT